MRCFLSRGCSKVGILCSRVSFPRPSTGPDPTLLWCRSGVSLSRPQAPGPIPGPGYARFCQNVSRRFRYVSGYRRGLPLRVYRRTAASPGHRNIFLPHYGPYFSHQRCSWLPSPGPAVAPAPLPTSRSVPVSAPPTSDRLSDPCLSDPCLCSTRAKSLGASYAGAPLAAAW